MNRPNLFSYGTSELSQDAFLCWLMDWANPQFSALDPNLHHIGKKFIEAIFKKHQQPVPTIENVSIIKQLDGLDILAVINDKYAILIEDKTYTNDHTNQLIRYCEAMKKRGYNYQLPIYYKIGNQSSFHTVETAGYKPFLRQDMLAILHEGYKLNIKDTIFNDYYQHLLSIDKAFNKYKTHPLNKWEELSWQGFYSELQKKGILGDWDYVSNPRGGFYGFWWNWGGNDECRQYLQLEQEKLCFKIEVSNKEKRSQLRSTWCQKILEKSRDFQLPVKRPSRFGNGKLF
ncbi:PD-(D/E)XK nuclease family protein, partial [Anoxybacillus gonensis]|uniref:PD-(D/E)XK nuclease family protein n=1 Tax=Anoxybacillus gonensis TaxID=198467 RepID=A0AAW7TFK6_9BACL